MGQAPGTSKSPPSSQPRAAVSLPAGAPTGSHCHHGLASCSAQNAPSTALAARGGEPPWSGARKSCRARKASETSAVALHTLPAGLALIAGLARLGEALGYEVERERPVGKAGAAVDLAWYAAGEVTVPLMVFEVESSASTSMANNAMKILARDADDFVKPLFFFHVLLSGGQDNDRIAQLRRQWGQHNYRVYRLNDRAESQRLLADVLSQHRRLRSHLSVAALDEVLQQDVWAEVDRSAVFDEVQARNFRAAFARDFALRAGTSSAARGYFLRYLSQVHSGTIVSDNSYGGYVGRTYPGMLEIGILGNAGILPDQDACDRLEAWQSRFGTLRAIGPHFGLSRDYDAFVLGSAPALYGILGLLARKLPKTLAWCALDLASIVTGARERGMPPELWLPGSLWAAHLIAIALVSSKDEQRLELEKAYGSTRRALNAAGGIPLVVLDAPPMSVDVDDPDHEWLQQMATECTPLPEWGQLNERYSYRADATLDSSDWADPLMHAIQILVSDDWVVWDSRGLASALRCEVLQP